MAHSNLDIKHREQILETMQYIANKIQNVREFKYKYETAERISAETGLKVSEIAHFLSGKEYPTREKFSLFRPFFDAEDFSKFERIASILYDENVFDKERTLIEKMLFELDKIKERLSELEERTDISDIKNIYHK